VEGVLRNLFGKGQGTRDLEIVLLLPKKEWVYKNICYFSGTIWEWGGEDAVVS